MTPRWMSHAVPSMGAAKAEGIRNQLGRPEIDRLTVLVREAAQNSWDARSGERPVSFRLDLRTMDGPMATTWREALSPDLPDPTYLPLGTVLDKAEPTVLFLSDHGTTGLGGPTKGSAAVGDSPHDYQSFVLNVGEPRNTPEGGGTYGFGKAAYFLCSQASTILVHTRTAAPEQESRLIGIALGNSYERDDQAYTGRHWFGLVSGDHVEPVRGEEADALAARLGFPSRAPDDTGTTIAIVGFDLDGRDATQAGETLASSILWHLWPKAIDRGAGRVPMAFDVTVDDMPIPIPDPRAHPVVGELVHALEAIPEDGRLITHRRRTVGRLVLRTAFAPLPPPDPAAVEAGLGMDVHHVCLLRAPELVVEYRPGPPMPNPGVWYVGVFRTDDDVDVDEVFAAAEPPTHDSWTAAQLPDQERSIVRTTLKKIDDALRDHSRPRPAEAEEGQAEGLGGVSRQLGNLLATAPGAAAGPRRNGPPRPPSSPVGSVIRTIDAPRWVEHAGELVLVQSFEVTKGRPVTVVAQLGIRLWGGGSEAQAPQGSQDADILGWRAPDGGLRAGDGPHLHLGASDDGTWEILVRPPADATLAIRIVEARDA
jgi:hypothetical protein